MRLSKPVLMLLSDLVPPVCSLVSCSLFLVYVWGKWLPVMGCACWFAGGLWQVYTCIHDWLWVRDLSRGEDLDGVIDIPPVLDSMVGIDRRPVPWWRTGSHDAE